MLMASIQEDAGPVLPLPFYTLFGVKLTVQDGLTHYWRGVFLSTVANGVFIMRKSDIYRTPSIIFLKLKNSAPQGITTTYWFTDTDSGLFNFQKVLEEVPQKLEYSSTKLDTWKKYGPE